MSSIGLFNCFKPSLSLAIILIHYPATRQYYTLSPLCSHHEMSVTSLADRSKWLAHLVNSIWLVSPNAGGMVACSLYTGLLKMSPASELPYSVSYTDYSCALQRDILLQGRLYLSENWICFYSNIFRWETLVKNLGWWGMVGEACIVSQW